MKHKVSLVGRHESNGCEASGKAFRRHLRTLVMDERIKSKWSDDTVLPLINFYLCSYPTSETGGLSPFQLKYGSQDAAYFDLPYWMDSDAKSIEFLKRLDKNLSVIREISQKEQDKMARERTEGNKSIPQYFPGDFLLWNAQENPCDHLDEKLATPWKGPYEVIEQVKNDIACTHLVLGEDVVLHVSRVKPFFGSREDAIKVAMTDKDQYRIVSIDWCEGNPHVRTSMVFGITWEDGFQAIKYNADLATSQQFKDYVCGRAYLFPLRFTSKQAEKEIRAINKDGITSVGLQQEVYLNLRYFDGINSSWYDSLGLPQREKDYVARGKVISWVNENQTKVRIRVDIFGATYLLTTYEVQAYLSKMINYQSMIEVTKDFKATLPQIWK